jgi:hypothetical protein
MGDRRKSDFKYGGKIPDDYLPAHNHVIHTPIFRSGVNGFRRFWIPPEHMRSGKWVECPCGWKYKHRRWTEPHYALADHAKWWTDEIEKRGSLEAVYQYIMKRLQIFNEHRDWDHEKICQAADEAIAANV